MNAQVPEGFTRESFEEFVSLLIATSGGGITNFRDKNPELTIDKPQTSL